MKIKVKIGKDREEKHCIKRIYLSLPNAVLKSRLAVKIIKSGIERDAEKGKKPVVSPDFITREFLKTMYAALKTVIKKHGHFNVVEVHSADGTEVLICV